MRVGLLWYDSDKKKPLRQKIDDAAEHYQIKFGTRPNACHVNPGEVAGHPRLRVVGNRFIRPNYFWLGVEQDESESVPVSNFDTARRSRKS